ncbi:MAG: choloylglycine hydrolase [Clostridia bacterium]|nr:choloylglycine hydrolase [Clostridia bacterium]
MCTAISVTVKDHYFGRNLDFHHTFGEKVTITPRNYCFEFTNGKKITEHYAIIGMALPYNDYPLYFDAVNEKGLGMAGLYFPDNAVYNAKIDNRSNIASFELIPWILTQCATVADAQKLLENINITDEAFDGNLEPSPLHWIISDKEESITLEQTVAGVSIYENPAGVLTNNPPFNMQMFNLNNYMRISSYEPENNFSDKIDLKPYSRGMGGIGIPGDLSSMSRFVRACFTKLNSVYGETDDEVVHQFFHILYSVYQQKGCVKVGDSFEITNYSSCCNADKGIYYYTTYYNSQIRAVDMYKENLDGEKIIVYEKKY